MYKENRSSMKHIDLTLSKHDFRGIGKESQYDPMDLEVRIQYVKQIENQYSK